MPRANHHQGRNKPANPRANHANKSASACRPSTGSAYTPAPHGCSHRAENTQDPNGKPHQNWKAPSSTLPSNPLEPHQTGESIIVDDHDTAETARRPGRSASLGYRSESSHQTAKTDPGPTPPLKPDPPYRPLGSAPSQPWQPPRRNQHEQNRLSQAVSTPPVRSLGPTEAPRKLRCQGRSPSLSLLTLTYCGTGMCFNKGKVFAVTGFAWDCIGSHFGATRLCCRC